MIFQHSHRACRSECCVPSGLDFEAAGDSVVRYFVCNYLLRGLRVTVNMTVDAVCKGPTYLEYASNTATKRNFSNQDEDGTT